MPLTFMILVCAVTATDDPAVPFPHPLVTELLYAVPPGDRGDASGDGIRDAVGDEFVELVNPHDKPIQLKGYTITDGTPDNPLGATPAPAPGSSGRPASADPEAGARQKQLRFTFPALELKPGEVVVVFNGYKQKIKGPVGDAKQAPRQKNDGFHGAYVFSMKNDSQYTAFANTADCMIVWDPDGKPVEAIHWRQNVRAAKDSGKGPGKAPSRDGKDAGGPEVATPGPASDKAVPPKGTILAEAAPESRGSVARVGVTKKLVAHQDLAGSGQDLFSPGRIDAAGTDPGPETPRPASPK